MGHSFLENVKKLFGIKYRDRKGQEMTQNEWMEIQTIPDDYRRVARNQIGKYLISTVWLGIEDLNGSFFETMVFNHEGDDPWHYLYDHTYKTEEEAKIGHETIVAIVQRCVDKGDEFEVVDGMN